MLGKSAMASECNERGHPVTIFWIATCFALAMTVIAYNVSLACFPAKVRRVYFDSGGAISHIMNSGF